MMKTITDKKEIIKHIGEWETASIYTEYEIGSNEIYLKYRGNEVVYKNNAKSVAYIALQCHAINTNQYANIAGL